MKPNVFLVCSIFAAICLQSSHAYSQEKAQEISKETCVDAHTKGQEARQSGKLTLAKQLLMSCSQTACPAIVRNDCARLADELNKLQPTVTFVARDGDGADMPNTTVFVDGALVLTRIDSGAAMDIDPGQHSIRFVSGSREQTKTVVIQNGEKARTILAVFESEQKDPTVSPVITAPQTNPSDTDESVNRPLGSYGLLGVGLAAVVGGGVLTYMGISDVPDGCSISGSTCNVAPGDERLEMASDGVRKMNIGLVLTGLGTAAMVGGAIWYYAGATNESEEALGAQLAPFFTSDRGGIALSGSW